MSDAYRIPEARCTECGKDIDGATALDGGRGPKPGDISLCFYCHHLMVYDEERKPRNPTDEEIVEIAGDPELVCAMNALGVFKQLEEGLKNAQAVIDDRAARRAREPR